MSELFSLPSWWSTDLAIVAITALGLLLALVIELRTDRVPDALVYPLIAIGFALAVLDDRWNLHLIGFTAASMVAIVYSARGWIPAGIAKLSMAIGLLAGAAPALAGLFLVMLVWPFLAWRNRATSNPDQRSASVHCSPQFVAGALLGMVALLII